jgi:hypothetical protein
MGFWGKIKTYLLSPANRPKVIYGAVAILAIVGLVLFGPQLENLFNRAPSQASTIEDDVSKTWKNLTPGTTDRAHAKAIAVTQGGKRWLYVMGGLETYTSGSGEKHNRLIKTVQRIELDVGSSAPVEGATWQMMPQSMNSGHAEFGVLTTKVGIKDYLYVVAGDIHIPTIDTIDPADVLTKVPLLYSTIERLDLSTNNAPWEVVANLSGVNFYPEVTMFDNRLHIVGGVYGNPFGQLDNCGPAGSGSYGAGTNTGSNGQVATDPLNLNDDQSLWNITKTKPTIGAGSIQNGISTPILPVADTNGGLVPVIRSVSAEDGIITEPDDGSNTGFDLDAGLNQDSNQSQSSLTQFFRNLFAHVPKAEAQSSITITRPEAGVVLQSGITYPIVIEIFRPLEVLVLANRTTTGLLFITARLVWPPTVTRLGRKLIPKIFPISPMASPALSTTIG